jgi:hypothetical protein
MSELLPRCPRCNARMVPNGNRLWCQFCGAERAEAEAKQLVERYQAYAATIPDDYEPPTRSIGSDPLLDRSLDDAWNSIRAGDLPNARLVLHHAQTNYPDCPDVWYLLALTTDAPREKLLYLDKALALQPYHEYAWRAKGVLEGVIPDAEALPVVPPGPGEPVEAESETQECPLCGGALAFDAALGALICGHCGHQPGRAVRRAGPARGGYKKLDDALIQRRFGFTREWQIGSRVLVCQNCHAQLTLAGTTLSTQCPFCDSAHVLIEDAVGSFEEPDALLPFQIDRQAAARAVHHRLAPDQRGEIERGDMWGLYLPFWDFAGIVSVLAPAMMPLPVAFRPGVFNVEHVLVGGVTGPAQAVLADLMPYDLRALTPYDARYLARWPAQIYSVDMIQASITARAYLKYSARQQATHAAYRQPEIDLARADFDGYNPPNTPLWRAVSVEIEGISYRLLLLPVWMITLYLRDGRHRPAVVNGQTGEALILDGFTGPERVIARPEHRNVIRPILPPIPVPPHRRNVIRPLEPFDRI